MKISLENQIQNEIILELKRRGRFTIKEAEAITASKVNSKYALFIVIRAIGKLCEEYRRENGKGPEVVLL